MPKLICHLPNGNFLEWSTVVDAPVTYGVPREKFDAYMRKEYGDAYMEFDHPRRMERAIACGTSSMIGGATSFEELVAHNRAGPNETCITVDEIMAEYGAEPPK